MPVKKSTPSYTAPALSRGLEILEYLANAAGPVSQVEIARDLGRKPGEQFRFLQVLESEGYLTKDSAGGYRLTLKLFRLAAMPGPMQLLVDSARSPMRGYSHAHGQECHLSVLEDGRLVVIARESGTEPIGLEVRSGSFHDPRTTTSGCLLLANLPADERDWQLQRAAEHFPTSSDSYADSMEQALPDNCDFIEAANGRLSGIRDIAVYLPGGASCPSAVLASSCLLAEGEVVQAGWKKSLKDAGSRISSLGTA